MSDGDWIDRVRNTRPEDYSSGDLGKLRDQARRSPEVRKAVADEIRLDQALHAATSRPLSTAKIVAHVTGVAAAGAAGASFFGTLAAWLGVLVLTGALVSVGLLVLPEPGASPQGETLPSGVGPLGVGQFMESPSPERIEPLQLDPRFVDDGSSPSDRRPPDLSTATAGKSAGIKTGAIKASNAIKSSDRKVADNPTPGK